MGVFRFEAGALDALIASLRNRGYQVVAPTPGDGAVIYDEVESASELPVGLSDSQEKGHYRLENNGTGSYFAYNVGPHSWKKYLFPNNHLLWRSHSEDGKLKILSGDPAEKPFAFLGVKPCELKAIAVQDKVFTQGPYPDSTYKTRREEAFLISTNCTRAGKTCFCTSMGGGPRAHEGGHLVLTEVVDSSAHYFIAEPHLDPATEILQEIGAVEVGEDTLEQVAILTARAEQEMGRTVDLEGVPEMLAANRNHSHWEEVGDRCLNCTNCTMVCPTCFCFSVEDHLDLAGQAGERRRNWDSCFNLSFSYQHGGSVRNSASSRYRQWMTHKLSSWQDQFGELGCVGCGRCVTWCPVGIDITEEVKALQEKTQ